MDGLILQKRHFSRSPIIPYETTPSPLPTLLALDTATEACSLALLPKGKSLSTMK